MRSNMLTQKQKRALMSRAALLNPVILIGNKGLTEAVHLEIEKALVAHELIKIRFHTKDRDWQKAASEEICQQHEADSVSHTGHVIVIYRENPDKKS